MSVLNLECVNVKMLIFLTVNSRSPRNLCGSYTNEKLYFLGDSLQVEYGVSVRIKMMIQNLET